MLQQTKIYKLRFQLEQWKIASKYLAIFLRFRIEYEKKNSTTVKEKIERLLKDEEIEVKMEELSGMATKEKLLFLQFVQIPHTKE